MNVRPISLTACFFAGLLSPETWADGGTLRLRERVGGYRIAVFTSPADFRVGPVDVSVLVQDAATGEPLSTAHVSVRMLSRSQPSVLLEHSATIGAATNKLFHAAEFELPRSGHWDVEIQIDGRHGSAQVHCEVEAGEPIPRWLEMWPWIVWPVVVLVLFGIHQVLVRRKSAVSGSG